LAKRGELAVRNAAVVFLVVVGVCSGTGAGAVIGFSGLVGSNGDAMPSPYVEAGFQVAPVVGDWQEAHVFGNPTPSIFSGSPLGMVRVGTAVPGGLFTFSSVDLADAGNGGAQYSLAGILSGVSVFSVNLTGPLPGSFVTINSPSNAVIDELLITMLRGTVTYNIDNIAVTAVPEPATLALLALGGLLLARRRV
jgi:hypothetical protein